MLLDFNALPLSYLFSIEFRIIVIDSFTIRISHRLNIETWNRTNGTSNTSMENLPFQEERTLSQPPVPKQGAGYTAGGPKTKGSGTHDTFRGSGNQ